MGIINETNFLGEDVTMQLFSISGGESTFLGIDLLTNHIQNNIANKQYVLSNVKSTLIQLLGIRCPSIGLDEQMVTDMYKFWVSDIYNQAAVGVINYIMSNKDDIFRRYYLDSPRRDMITADIINVRYSLNLPDEDIVVCLFLHKIIDEYFNRGGEMLDYYDRGMLTRLAGYTTMSKEELYNSLMLVMNFSHIHYVKQKVYNVVNVNLNTINAMSSSELMVLLNKYQFVV